MLTVSLQINPSVFREYDVRGVAGKDLSGDFAESLGLAYAQLISGQVPTENRNHLTISVGRDCRLSSLSYATALISGLRKGGIDVIDIGNCPTPVTYFSLFHLALDGGIMVTASHLPADHNGFKFCVGRDAIYGEKIQELRKIMEKDLVSLPAEKMGSLSQYEIIPAYLDYLMAGINLTNKNKVTNSKMDTKPNPITKTDANLQTNTDLKTSVRPKKIVIDCGNGNGSQVVPQIFKMLNADVIELFCDMDGRFPNHVPDPSVSENLVDLIAAVKKNQADFGIGIDGDADRLGVVDENGRLLYGDELLVIFSRDILKEHPGATVVSEVKSSYRLYDDITKHGGQPIMWKTGHSLIEAKMKESGALLGGEMSGHMFFADKYFGYDDAVYAALRVYEIASRHAGEFSSLISDLPKTVSTPEIRRSCSDQEKFAVIKRIEKILCGDPKINKNKISLIDGIRIDFGDGWGLIRASNTEPVLSLRFEAISQPRLDEIRSVFENALEESRSK